MWISGATSSPTTYRRWLVVTNPPGRTAWGTSARYTTPRGRRRAADSIEQFATRSRRCGRGYRPSARYHIASMPEDLFAALDASLRSHGPQAGFELLIVKFREEKKYPLLF